MNFSKLKTIQVLVLVFILQVLVCSYGYARVVRKSKLLGEVATPDGIESGEIADVETLIAEGDVLYEDGVKIQLGDFSVVREDEARRYDPTLRAVQRFAYALDKIVRARELYSKQALSYPGAQKKLEELEQKRKRNMGRIIEVMSDDISMGSDGRMLSKTFPDLHPKTQEEILLTLAREVKAENLNRPSPFENFIRNIFGLFRNVAIDMRSDNSLVKDIIVPATTRVFSSESEWERFGAILTLANIIGSMPQEGNQELINGIFTKIVHNLGSVHEVYHGKSTLQFTLIIFAKDNTLSKVTDEDLKVEFTNLMVKALLSQEKGFEPTYRDGYVAIEDRYVDDIAKILLSLDVSSVPGVIEQMLRNIDENEDIRKGIKEKSYYLWHGLQKFFARLTEDKARKLLANAEVLFRSKDSYKKRSAIFIIGSLQPYLTLSERDIEGEHGFAFEFIEETTEEQRAELRERYLDKWERLRELEDELGEIVKEQWKDAFDFILGRRKLYPYKTISTMGEFEATIILIDVNTEVYELESEIDAIRKVSNILGPSDKVGSLTRRLEKLKERQRRLRERLDELRGIERGLRREIYPLREELFSKRKFKGRLLGPFMSVINTINTFLTRIFVYNQLSLFGIVGVVPDGIESGGIDGGENSAKPNELY